MGEKRIYSEEMRAENLSPAYPTHPGALIKDEIEYRGISQRQLAKDMGIGHTVLNEMLNEHRPITERSAMLFEATLGVEADLLLRMQSRYNMQTLKRDNSFMKRLDSVRKTVASL